MDPVPVFAWPAVESAGTGSVSVQDLAEELYENYEKCGENEEEGRQLVSNKYNLQVLHRV